MKISKIILSLFLLSVFLLSCSKDDDGGSNEITKGNNGVFLQEINTAPLVQYTPNLSPWGKFEDVPLQSLAKYNPVGYNSHSLSDFRLMTEVDWKKNHWDGTPFNPEKLTRVELHKAMFPIHGVMVGLKQLYEKHKPFKNEKKPTKAEVDEWNRLVLNHFRALCGYGAKKHNVTNAHMLYIRTLWSDEAKYSNKWDNELYRGGKTVRQDKNAMPKYLERLHYGFDFKLSIDKQKPYYPSGVAPTCCESGGSEGVSGVRKWTPWSTKLSVVLSEFIRSEGFWGGHLGPLWHCEKIGISYYKELPRVGTGEPDDRWVQVRFLYQGEISKELYEDPDGVEKKAGNVKTGNKY